MAFDNLRVRHSGSVAVVTDRRPQVLNALNTQTFGVVASTADMREGTRAFLEKRRADFRGL